MIEISTLHCWELYTSTVRGVVTKINRLYDQWEKYVRDKYIQEKLRHKEMKECLCKEKSALQHLVAQGCIFWCLSHGVAFIRCPCLGLQCWEHRSTLCGAFRALTGAKVNLSPGIRHPSFRGQRERVGIPRAAFSFCLPIPVQGRVTAPTPELGDAPVFGEALPTSRSQLGSCYSSSQSLLPNLFHFARNV